VARQPRGSSGKCPATPQARRYSRSYAHPAPSFDQRELARREAADMRNLNSHCITGI
jgi:hypothetical protein